MNMPEVSICKRFFNFIFLLVEKTYLKCSQCKYDIFALGTFKILKRYLHHMDIFIIKYNLEQSWTSVILCPGEITVSYDLYSGQIMPWLWKGPIKKCFAIEALFRIIAIFLS